MNGALARYNRVAGLPVAWCRTPMSGAVAQGVQPTQPVDSNREQKAGMLDDRDVVAESRSLADTSTLHFGQLADLTADVPAKGDLESSGGIDNGAPVGAAPVRGPCVTAEHLFQRRFRTVTDEPEDGSPIPAHARDGHERLFAILKPRAPSCGGSMNVSPAPTGSAS
jgi:hypothetical protein